MQKKVIQYMPGLADVFEPWSLKISLLVSIPIATAQAFMDKYVFDHSGWIQAIGILVIFDTITGIWKSLKLSKFSSYKFGAVLIKTVIYAMVVFVLGGLYRVENETTQLIATLGYTAIAAREFLSLVENVEIIRPGTFPKWLITRLDQFDKEGKHIGQDQSTTV